MVSARRSWIAWLTSFHLVLRRRSLGASLCIDGPGILGEGERIVWAIAIWYAVLTAIRLARYNVEQHSGRRKTFRGLPSSGAAAALCSWILLLESIRYDIQAGEIFGYSGCVSCLFIH